MKSILDYIERIKRENEGERIGPRIRAETGGSMPEHLTKVEPEINDNFWINHYRQVIDARLGAMEAVRKRGEPTNPDDAKYLFEQYNELKKYGGDTIEFDQRIKNLSPLAEEPEFAAHGGRIGKPGGLVEPGVEYYGREKILLDLPKIIKTFTKKKPEAVEVGQHLKNLLASRTPYTGAEKIGVSTLKTDWTTEKIFTTKFKEYMEDYFHGNFKAAAESLGENRNKIKGIFHRLLKHETGQRKYGQISTASEMRVNIPEPQEGIAYKDATTFVKKDSNFLKKFITEENTGQFLSPKEIGHSLGIKFKNKGELDRFVADLNRFHVESQPYVGKQSLYNFDDAVNKITAGYKKKLVKGDVLAQTKRVEIEKRLDHELFNVRSKIKTQVKTASKNENIYLQNAIDDLGHPVSIKITDKYPKLFKNSTVNRINSLVYQDPYINQDVMKLTGYETKFDSMFKELDSLVNKPVTEKTQIQILNIKKHMNINYNNLIETISNPKKLKMVMEDAGKGISLSHLKNISTQTNRIPRIDVNVPEIGSTFKSSDIYVDMSKVDSAYIIGNVNKINPDAKYFKDLSSEQKALYEANMKEQAAGILENYYKKAKFPKEQIDELRETLTYDYAKGGRVGLADGTAAVAERSTYEKITNPFELSFRDRAKIFGTAAIGDWLVLEGALTNAFFRGLPILWTPGATVYREGIKPLVNKLMSGKEPKIEDFAEVFKEGGYDINSEEFKSQWNAAPEKERKKFLYDLAGKTIDERSTGQKIKEKAASPLTHLEYGFWASGVKAMEKLLKANPGSSVLKNRLKQALLFGIRSGISTARLAKLSPWGYGLFGLTTYSKIQQEFEGKMRKTPLTESEHMDIQKRKEAVPTMLNVFDQASQRAKDQGISYEDALKQIKTDTPLDIPGLDFKIDYSLPKPIETLAGGGMVGIRKPNAIAPTGGPMHQGLRSLYINDRDY